MNPLGPLTGPLMNSPFSCFPQSNFGGSASPFGSCGSPDQAMFSQMAVQQQAMMSQMLLGFLMGMMAGFAQHGNSPSGGFPMNGGAQGSGGPMVSGLAGNYAAPHSSPGGHSHGGPSGSHGAPSPAASHPQADQTWNNAQHSGKGFSFNAGMAIDTDGVGSSHGDRWHQNQTSMTLANGRSLNADTTPYMVLPPQLAKKYGCKPGDLALVKYKGKVSPAIFGDVGPKNKLGEGSTRLAANLGINTDPNRGGTDGGVQYQVFPGSGRGIKWTQENSTTDALWQRIQSMNLTK